MKNSSCRRAPWLILVVACLSTSCMVETPAHDTNGEIASAQAELRRSKHKSRSKGKREIRLGTARLEFAKAVGPGSALYERLTGFRIIPESKGSRDEAMPFEDEGANGELVQACLDGDLIIFDGDQQIVNPTYQECVDAVQDLMNAQTPLQNCSDGCVDDYFDCMAQGQGASADTFEYIRDQCEGGHDSCVGDCCTAHGQGHPGCNGG